MTQSSFSNKTVVITGAGSGLGRALALQFASQGWKVAVSDASKDTAQATVDMIEKSEGSAFANQTDVRSTEDFAAFKQEVESKFGQLDVLINNAGVSDSGTLEDVSLDDFNWMMDINLLGVIRGYKAFIPLLKQSPRAHVINIASFAGIANPPATAAYNISKASVIAASETIRTELSQTSVGVSVVCPAFFKTNLLSSFRSDAHNVKSAAGRLMERSPLTAEILAKDIYDSMMAKEFLVLAPKITKTQNRIKRWFPEWFSKKLIEKSKHLVTKSDS